VRRSRFECRQKSYGPRRVACPIDPDLPVLISRPVGSSSG
jgi:hypothetical protein